MKVAGNWPKESPADYEGHKNFIEKNKDKLKPSKSFHLEMELDQLHQMYPYFDARRWRILKAGGDTGGFVTTDHPVCVHRAGDAVRENVGYWGRSGSRSIDNDFSGMRSSPPRLRDRV
jgi:hypothetical protein